MHEWFEHIIEAVQGNPEEPVLAAHVAVVALHAALLASISGFGPNAPSIRVLHAYDRIIIDSGRRSAWVMSCSTARPLRSTYTGEFRGEDYGSIGR